jgi:hypothetical protein
VKAVNAKSAAKPIKTRSDGERAGNAPSAAPLAVNVDNFTRAETDRYFTDIVASAGAIGVLDHGRDPASVDQQFVIRMQRDTLYSKGIFDLTEPVTITVPGMGSRFLSMIVVNQDHYIKLVTYEPGAYRLSAKAMGTRYVAVLVRTFMDPNDPADVRAANALQDQIMVKQKSPGVLDLPAWDKTSLDACRAAVSGLAPFMSDARDAFGDVDEVDQVRHLIGTAVGWGGNSEKDAKYLIQFPSPNDGKTPMTLTVKDVPVYGFWSITVYDAQGYMEPNDFSAWAINNVTAKPNADGSFTVRFGGDPKADNFLYTMPEWNYVVRLYRPRSEMLDGSWVFPKPEVVGEK